MKHIIEKHTELPEDTVNFQCPDCPKKFPMESVLKYHQNKVHEDRRKICPICGKVRKLFYFTY